MMRRMFLILLVLIMELTLTPFAGEQVQAKAAEIQVYLDGERLKFEDADPIATNGRTLVPFRKIFETLGFKVTWIGSEQKAIGTKEDLTIELTLDSKKAKVNGKTIELDVPAQSLKGRTLVPLRFVSENSGYHVYYANENGVSIIGIGSTKESANPGVTLKPSTPEPSSGGIEPYVAKGRIVNSQGQPLPWAVVFADNTFLYNSNILGTTDENGYYRLELPEVSASYQMGARYETDYQGKAYTFDIEPQLDRPFAGNTGAVRDFVLDIDIGEVELYSWDYAYPDDDNAPEFELGQIELRLEPVGKLADGSTGSTITGYPIYEDGVRLKGIPVGTYQVTAVWKPEGYMPVSLLVSIRNAEQYKESVTYNFNSPFSGYFHTQLEVKFP
jgi:hypothetical protein